MGGNVAGVISVHVDDLVIYGRGKFIGYITNRTKERTGVGTFDGNGAEYLGIYIRKAQRSSRRMGAKFDWLRGGD